MFTELSTELLRSGYAVRFRAAGRSMAPAIRDGETITVTPVAPSAVRRGDVILYRSDRGIIAHRVVRITKVDGVNTVFTLRGDASATRDEPVRAGQILGVVIPGTSRRPGGRLAAWRGRLGRTFQRARLMRGPV